jgi:hypothetical protein
MGIVISPKGWLAFGIELATGLAKSSKAILLVKRFFS